MKSSSTEPAIFSPLEGNFQQLHRGNTEHPTPKPLTFSLASNFTKGLLVGVLVLMGYLAQLVADSLQAAQVVPRLAAAGETASNTGREKQQEGAELFQLYTGWLRTSHVHAALHGQDVPIPNQF